MRKQLSVRTFAKINLTLDVTEKRPDGYHNIDSIFEEISLHDVITIKTDGTEQISITCSVCGIPCDEKNITWKAATEFFSYTKIKNPGISIHIEKNIPSEAGMGGGSTNSAGVIKLLNTMFKTELSTDELISIALKTGADAPFFINGGLAHITGIGEKITPLNPLPLHYITIAKGNSGVSTPAAYRQIDSLSDVPHQNTSEILKCIDNSDITGLMKNCLNTFELTELPDDIENIKIIMAKHNSIKALMTGSGAAVFGIFENRKSAEAACEELKKSFSFAGVYTNII